LLENGVCGELQQGAKNLVNIALKNSQRLGVLVNDLLDMEKLASGKMTINIERLNLVALIKQSVEANTGYARNLSVDFVFEQYPKQAWALGDSNRLMQVLANLLSNAAKFSHPGGQVDIKLIDAAGLYRVEVHDHGMGIADGFKDRVFKKFAQADDGDTRRQGGTGLGLNITQRLVEKMGGQIGFESEVGLGTVFWFSVLSGVQRVSDSR
jgi:signal transduction histidine kinase